MLPTGMPTPQLALALISFENTPGSSPTNTTDAFNRALHFARSHNCTAVQLNAASPVTRPRTLDRSTRRGIAATLRRNSLVFAGTDIFIPPKHLADPAHADRAADALTDAAEFTADIAQLTPTTAATPVLSVALPPIDPNNQDATPITTHHIIEALAAAAQTAGIPVADHAQPAGSWDHLGIKRGIDPAAVILAGSSPQTAIADAAAEPRRLVSTRLSDITATGRTTPGQGSLDPTLYTIACQTAFRDTPPPPLTIDLRNIQNPTAALKQTIETLGIQPPNTN